MKLKKLEIKNIDWLVFGKANFRTSPALFVKSKVYKEEELFNFDFKFVEDYELMLRMFKNTILNLNILIN